MIKISINNKEKDNWCDLKGNKLVKAEELVEQRIIIKHQNEKIKKQNEEIKKLESNKSKNSKNNIRPQHYKANIKGLDVEAKDIMKSYFGASSYKEFCRNNALKYLLRSENKNGLEDLKKADYYIKEIIELEEQ